MGHIFLITWYHNINHELPRSPTPTQKNYLVIKVCQQISRQYTLRCNLVPQSPVYERPKLRRIRTTRAPKFVLCLLEYKTFNYLVRYAWAMNIGNKDW